MKISVHSVCHNEELILPYFLRHYQSFADEIHIWDNLSTDNSVSICQEANVILGKIHSSKCKAEVLAYIKNFCWKDSDANWVFVVDIDEFVYHPDIRDYLARQDTYTILKPKTYQMVSEKTPTSDGQIYEEIKRGVLATGKIGRKFGVGAFHKLSVFNPKQVRINYSVNGRTAHPTGNVKIKDKTELKLLHYRFLGNCEEKEIQKLFLDHAKDVI